MLSQYSWGGNKSEDGFTLVELLVVILIIGVLAAIAIPAFLNQRKAAVEASMKSDLKSAVTEMQTAYLQNRNYPVTLPSTAKVSDGNTVTLAKSKNLTDDANAISKSYPNTFVFDAVDTDGNAAKLGLAYESYINPWSGTNDGVVNLVPFDPQNNSSDTYLRGVTTGHPFNGKSLTFQYSYKCANQITGAVTSAAVTGTSYTRITLQSYMISGSINCPSNSVLSEFTLMGGKTQQDAVATGNSKAVMITSPTTTKKPNLRSIQDYCLNVSSTGTTNKYFYSSTTEKVSPGSC